MPTSNLNFSYPLRPDLGGLYEGVPTFDVTFVYGEEGLNIAWRSQLFLHKGKAGVNWYDLPTIEAGWTNGSGTTISNLSAIGDVAYLQSDGTIQQGDVTTGTPVWQTIFNSDGTLNAETAVFAVPGPLYGIFQSEMGDHPSLFAIGPQPT